MITPDYYEQFRCIGGECLHNCCRGGWEIEVDDDALERFERIGGEFGKRVRAAVNEDNVFINTNGHCPLLSEDGWCDMVRHGEKLCVICDEYPRFTEFYEDYAERGISVSCEAAADIILSNAEKVKLIGSTGACDEPIFVFINNARGTVFEILQNRELDIFTRLRLALDYSAEVQERINENRYEDFSYVPIDYADKPRNLTAYIGLLRELEVLDPHWLGMLDAVCEHEKTISAHAADPLKCEQLAVYFVYRYFLKGAFDCDVLSKMKFAVLSVMTVIALENTFGDICECARLYSVEIEHDEDNIDAIYDGFLFNEELSYESILNMIN